MVPDTQLFLDHLETLFGKKASSFSQLDGRDDETPVFYIFFRDIPEPGYLTVVTYGLSLAEHPEWTGAKPEVMLCLETRSEVWGDTAAKLVEAFRGNCPFRYGDVLNWGKPVAPPSELSAFYVFSPALPNRFLREDEATIRLNDHSVFLVSLYPVHSGEIELMERIGIDQLWQLPQYDPFAPHRPDVSQATTV